MLHCTCAVVKVLRSRTSGSWGSDTFESGWAGAAIGHVFPMPFTEWSRLGVNLRERHAQFMLNMRLSCTTLQGEANGKCRSCRQVEIGWSLIFGSVRADRSKEKRKTKCTHKSHCFRHLGDHKHCGVHLRRNIGRRVLRFTHGSSVSYHKAWCTALARGAAAELARQIFGCWGPVSIHDKTSEKKQQCFSLTAHTMAEVLGIADSVKGLTTIADAIVRKGFRYMKDVKDAEKTVEKLVEEVNNLSGVLHSLNNVVERLEEDDPDVDPATQIHYIESCYKTLKKIQDLFDEAVPTAPLSKRDRLKWPLKKERTKELLVEIGRHKSTMILAMTAREM
jgi:uncharacterized protein YoxC